MPPRQGSGLTRRGFLGTVGVAAVAGCTGPSGSTPTETATTSGDPYVDPTPGGDPGWTPPTTSPRVDVEVETLVENLDIPWDIAVAGDGTLYMTERTGAVLRFDSGEVSEIARPQDAIDAESLAPGSDESSWLVEGGEGGTLGVAVHPSYPDEPYVYVYYTAETGDGRQNRVVRYDTSADDVAGTEETIVGAIPADTYHNGGRIRFGPDGNLWICCGDALARERAQDLSYLGGKILRVTPEGEVPPSNPDLDGDPRIFSYGHRNPQGIDWLPSGVPVATEHGPTNRDEVNVLVPGGNYGWPTARTGPDDDHEEFASYTDVDGVVPPLVNTGPDTGWAPSGATFYTGSGFEAWRNRLIVGGLVSQSVWVVTVTPPGTEPPPVDGEGQRYDADWLHPAYTATAHRTLQDELGRVRHVAESPDGDLYAITSNRDGRAQGRFPRETDDVLVRLTPA